MSEFQICEKQADQIAETQGADAASEHLDQGVENLAKRLRFSVGLSRWWIRKLMADDMSLDEAIREQERKREARGQRLARWGKPKAAHRG